MYDGTAWVAAATDPGLGSGVITIRNGHIATLASSETLDQLIVEAGGTLRVSVSRNLNIGNGVEPFDLDVYGTVENNGNINVAANPGAAIRFNDNSVYNHRLNGGAIPEATWLTNSTCLITGVTNILPGGMNQVFGNFTWNCPNQISDADINANLEVRGVFTMANTGSRYLRVATSGSYTMNLGGYTQTGGRLNLATGGFTCTFNLAGDFNFSGGSFLTSGSGIGNINFTGPGVQKFNRTGGNFSNTRLNYTVYNGAILDMGTSIIDVSGSFVAAGTFTLNDGAGLMLGDPYGITAATTGVTGGNIRVLGTRVFSQAADYTYNGIVPQVTGDGLPATVRNFTVDNPQGVTLTGDLSMTGLLTMSQGNVTTAGNAFFLSNGSAPSLVYTGGTVIGTFERNIAQTGQNYLFPIGSSARTQSFVVRFTDLVPGSLQLSFVEGDPGNTGLPLTDGGSYTITNQYTTGYWIAIAKNSLSTANYDVALDATGFGPYPVTAGTRLIRRNGTADWTLDGLHAGVSGSVVSRTGLTQSVSSGPEGTQFCVGKTGPFITLQPADKTLCQGTSDLSVFQVIVSGYNPLSYQWYRASGELLTNDGHYTGTTSSALGINNIVPGDAGEYYCVITDGRGENIETRHAVLNVPSVSFGFNYYTELSVSQASGSQDLADFPVLVNITRDFLRTVGNGGHVTNNSGYDIIFVDSGNNKLNHEIESYDPLTGNFVAWVRLPVLSSSGPTAIRMVYGNPSVLTDPSTESTWISSYKGVWHLSNNSVVDATSFNNDLTNNGSINTSGLIEEARSLDGVNDNLRSNTTTGIGPNAYNQTVSAWSFYNSLPNETQNLVVLQRAGSPSAVQMGFREVSGSNRVVVWNWGGNPLVWSNSLPSANTWHYFTYTFDGTTHRLYIDGIEAGSSTTATTQNAVPQYLYLGSYSGGEYFEGIIDEARYSLTQKTAGWIETEYDNQSAPVSFISVGLEQSMNSLVSAGVCNGPVSLSGYPTGGNFSGPGVTGTIFNPGTAGPGTHLITYTHNVDGCSVSISKSITVTPVPSGPATWDEFCCVRNVADLDASGSNLKWYSNSGLTTLVGWGTPFASGQTATGIYTYYVTQTVNGCESTASPAVLTIYPNTPVGGTATVSRTPECVGNMATLTLTGYTGRIIGWQKKLASDTEWITIPGSNSSPFSEVLAVAGTWQYRAVVSVGLCGSAYSSIATITVIEDIAGPVISGCPSNITAYTGPLNPDCSQIVTWTEPTAVDYCEGPVTFASRSHAPGSSFPVGTTTVSYTFTDGTNVSTCMFDVSVVDNTIPTITCPANVTNVPADAGQCYATGVALGTPTTGDNCGVATVTNNAPAPSSLSARQHVIWTVTDIHGNTATCTQTVTVVDTQNPTITCPANVTNVPADAGQCYATGVALGTPTTGDNCGVATVTNNAPAQFPVGTTNVIWTVTDIHGNTATCTQTVTVVDTQNPTITCPANVTNVPADAGQCYATGVALGTPTTGDNCGVATVTNNAPAQFPTGNTTVTWVVTDVHGNTATCEQIVTVIDSEFPTFTVPADITIYKDATCNYNATVGVTGDVTDEADNCDTSLNATFTDAVAPGLCEGEEIITRTWILSDDYGNTTTHIQIITVRDTTPPTFTVPADITIYKDATCELQCNSNE